MIDLQIRGSLLDVESQDFISRRVLFFRLETIRTELLLPSVLHEAIALCGHCCLTVATAKVPLHHYPRKERGEIVNVRFLTIGASV